MFNSALIYELAVLKQYAEPILYSVPRDSAEYNEAKAPAQISIISWVPSRTVSATIRLSAANSSAEAAFNV